MEKRIEKRRIGAVGGDHKKEVEHNTPPQISYHFRSILIFPIGVRDTTNRLSSLQHLQ